MTVSIPLLTIDIAPRGDGGRYKSIAKLSWKDIPGFAILTGKNGSGKTQLLELLAYHLSGALPHEFAHQLLPVTVSMIGETYTPDQIAYVPSEGRFSGGTAASLQTMAQYRNQAIVDARNPHTYRHDISKVVRAHRILTRLGGKSLPPNGDLKNFEEFLKDDDFVADDIDITASLTHVFMAHRFKILEALEQNTPGIGKDGKPLGIAPWEVLNEILRTAGFPYEVISPLGTDLLGTYELRLRDRSLDIEIFAINLSSGEKVLLQVVLWLFSASKNGKFPKLLLLDEPDAHLHPSMTMQFLDVIADVLVKRHGIRVIMTTHSPSTVALAPESCVFQLERGAHAVTPIASQPSIISILTAGLVTVSRSTKFCFVEDEDDAVFYAAVYELLMDHGPSRDPLALRPSPSIAFIPASIGTRRDKISGGSTVVTKWVDKLDTDPLDKIFFGIIDRDAANTSNGRVRVLGRYSFENYLLDPLILFSLLVEEGIPPDIQDAKISSGDEHLLRLQPEQVLQNIVYEIVTKMQESEPALITGNFLSVKYTVGMQVTVPSWVVDYRGHDLLQIAQKAFGARIVTPPRLAKALRRCRLLPIELAELLAEIQQA